MMIMEEFPVDHDVDQAEVTAAASSAPSLLGIEDDALLCQIITFCDFPSALRLLRATCRSLRERLFHQKGHHFLWRELFHRHWFSLPVTTTTSAHPQTQGKPLPILSSGAAPDYLLETIRRRQLDRNLLSVPRKSRGKRSSSYCFNLQHRKFNFVPISPLEEEDDSVFANDPPPVHFECESFQLTSSACGGEMVLLNPFHGGILTVYESCLDNAITSDEATRTMEHTMLRAVNPTNNNSHDGTRRHEPTNPSIAGSEEKIPLEEEPTVKPPFQILFRFEEDTAVSPLDIFPEGDNLGHAGGGAFPEDGVDVGYHGIDTKCILQQHDGECRTSKVAGTMVAVVRMFTKEIPAAAAAPANAARMHRPRHDEMVCTELHVWSRRTTGNKESKLFGSHQICRFPWSFRSMDICATHNCVYVSFDAHDGPLAQHDNNTDERMLVSGSTIVVYPLGPYCPRNNDRGGNNNNKYQEPEGTLQCQGAVSTLAIDPIGESLLVGTERGTCEVWSIASSGRNARRMAVISIRSCISKAFKAEQVESGATNQFQDSTEEVMRRRKRTLLQILGRRLKIVSFHFPQHLPFSACGFVTLQHSSSEGSSLLLWRPTNRNGSSSPFANGDDAPFTIVSMINLPLSGRTIPRVFYDGRRILVFGQDHIGFIILVFQVLASNETINCFQGQPTIEETSGGVYNLTNPPRVRFANRIRHAALGGLQHFDSLHITCNDRFIVVNTKTGNLVSDSATWPFYTDGLLVIDLQD